MLQLEIRRQKRATIWSRFNLISLQGHLDTDSDPNGNSRATPWTNSYRHISQEEADGDSLFDKYGYSAKQLGRIIYIRLRVCLKNERKSSNKTK